MASGMAMPAAVPVAFGVKGVPARCGRGGVRSGRQAKRPAVPTTENPAHRGVVIWFIMIDPPLNLTDAGMIHDFVTFLQLQNCIRHMFLRSRQR